MTKTIMLGLLGLFLVIAGGLLAVRNLIVIRNATEFGSVGLFLSLLPLILILIGWGFTMYSEHKGH